MVMANVDRSCNCWPTQSRSWLAWSEGRLPPYTSLHSSNETGDSAINIAVVITIIVIIIVVITLYSSFLDLLFVEFYLIITKCITMACTRTVKCQQT